MGVLVSATSVVRSMTIPTITCVVGNIDIASPIDSTFRPFLSNTRHVAGADGTLAATSSPLSATAPMGIPVLRKSKLSIKEPPTRPMSSLMGAPGPPTLTDTPMTPTPHEAVSTLTHSSTGHRGSGKKEHVVTKSMSTSTGGLVSTTTGTTGTHHPLGVMMTNAYETVVSYVTILYA